MLSKDLVNKALDDGIPFDEVWAFLTSGFLRSLLDARKFELQNSILNLNFEKDDNLALTYRAKRQQLDELTDFLEFRQEFIRKHQQPQEQ